MLHSLSSTSPWRTFVCFTVALGCVSVSALPPERGTTLPELLSVQKAVQAVLPVAEAALVALESNDGAATGVIVSPEGLILTAAHVATEQKADAKPGRKLDVFFANGQHATAHTLGFDLSTDAAMLQLDGPRRNWPYVTRHTTGADVQVGDWCFALGHPGGRDESRGSVLRMGKVLKIAPNTLQSDCVLMGGDSGGPLFNLSGELIGIHSQIWEDRDQNVHVSLAPFLRSWEAMQKSQVIRAWDRGAGGWLGIATRVGSDGAIEVDEVAQNSPAQRAGLRSGDHLVSIDRNKLASSEEFSNAVKTRAAGDSVVLVVRNRAGERIVTVKLSQQPEE